MRTLKAIITSVLLLGGLTAFAQKETTADNVGLVYRYESTIGAFIHTNGLGVMYRTGINVTGFNKRLWQFSLYYNKHPKESRSINPYYENARGFIYGKLHSLTVLSAGHTWQRTIYSKGDKGGIEIRYNFGAAGLLGLYKPMYLKVINTGADTASVELYDPNKHKLVNILGRGGIFDGWNKVAPRPGLQLTAGFSFEFARDDNKVRAIETGVQFDIFAWPKQMMAFSPNRPYYLNFYLAFHYGRKKN